MYVEQDRVKLVLERLAQIAVDDIEDAIMLSEALNEFLDELHCDDFFGTEGQNDPRGDFRDDTWSMNYVQNIDDQQ